MNHYPSQGIIQTQRLHCHYGLMQATTDRLVRRSALPDQVQMRYGAGVLHPEGVVQRFQRQRVESPQSLGTSWPVRGEGLMAVGTLVKSDSRRIAIKGKRSQPLKQPLTTHQDTVERDFSQDRIPLSLRPSNPENDRTKVGGIQVEKDKAQSTMPTITDSITHTVDLGAMAVSAIAPQTGTAPQTETAPQTAIAPGATIQDKTTIASSKSRQIDRRATLAAATAQFQSLPMVQPVQLQSSGIPIRTKANKIDGLANRPVATAASDDDRRQNQTEDQRRDSGRVPFAQLTAADKTVVQAKAELLEPETGQTTETRPELFWRQRQDLLLAQRADISQENGRSSSAREQRPQTSAVQESGVFVTSTHPKRAQSSQSSVLGTIVQAKSLSQVPLASETAELPTRASFPDRSKTEQRDSPEYRRSPSVGQSPATELHLVDIPQAPRLSGLPKAVRAQFPQETEHRDPPDFPLVRPLDPVRLVGTVAQAKLVGDSRSQGLGAGAESTAGRPKPLWSQHQNLPLVSLTPWPQTTKSAVQLRATNRVPFNRAMQPNSKAEHSRLSRVAQTATQPSTRRSSALQRRVSSSEKLRRSSAMLQSIRANWPEDSPGRDRAFPQVESIGTALVAGAAVQAQTNHLPLAKTGTIFANKTTIVQAKASASKPENPSTDRSRLKKSFRNDAIAPHQRAAAPPTRRVWSPQVNGDERNSQLRVGISPFASTQQNRSSRPNHSLPFASNSAPIQAKQTAPQQKKAVADATTQAIDQFATTLTSQGTETSQPTQPLPSATPINPDTVNVQQLAEQVSRILSRQISVERERRGISRWY